MSALFLRVWVGATPTVACTGAWRMLQDGWTFPSVSHSMRRPRDPDLSRRENRFCNRCGREHEGAQGYGLHGHVGDGKADIWATVNRKRVGLHVTMTDIGICDQDTIRCCGRPRGHSGSVEVLSLWARNGVANQRTLLSVWVPKTTSSLGLLRGPRQPNPTLRHNRRQNRTTNQQGSPAAAVQQFPPPPQQQQADDGDTAGTLHPFALDYVWPG